MRLLPSTLRPVIPQIAEILDISLQTDTVLYSTNPFDRSIRQVSTQDVNGELDIAIKDAFQEKQFSHGPFNERERPLYLWYGLLRDESGTVVVPSTATPTGNALFSVDIRSSPHGINIAQQALGRIPGVDAFSLQRQPSRGPFKAGEYLAGFANLHVLAADLTNPAEAEHDTNPSDHVLSWIMTPPALCEAIAVRARAIQTQYNKRIHEAPAQRPSEVSLFAAAADSLREFTWPIFQTIGSLSIRLENDKLTVSDAVKKLDASLNANQDDTMAYVDPKTRKPRNYSSQRLLQELGIISDSSWLTKTKQHRRATRAYAGHTATLLLRAEEITTQDNPAQKQRTDFWHRIAIDYSNAQNAA